MSVSSCILFTLMLCWTVGSRCVDSGFNLLTCQYPPPALWHRKGNMLISGSGYRVYLAFGVLSFPRRLGGVLNNTTRSTRSLSGDFVLSLVPTSLSNLRTIDVY